MDFAELFSKPEVIWFLIGLVLIMLEFALPGLIIVFFGVGAWVTSLTCLIFAPGFNIQLAIFIVFSLASLILLRKQLKNKFFAPDTPGTDTLEDEFIGKTAVVIAPISIQKMGKVNFKGTDWTAFSEHEIKKGQNVRIIGKDSINLKVEPL